MSIETVIILDDIVSVIHQNYNRDFLGWMGPGFDKFTLSGTFASSFVEFIKPKIDTKIIGSVRSIIPMGNWDKVLSDDVIWPDIKKMMNNYKKFLTYDKNKCKIILMDLIKGVN